MTQQRTPSVEHPIVVKVGGSLFDLADLGSRLRHWLASLGTPHVILLPGGGAAADVVRELDRVHQLGDEKAHWLALRSLTLTAHFLAELLPSSKVVGSIVDCRTAHAAGLVPILDAWLFAVEDEAHPGHLPHNWSATSDSFAARLAQRCRASKLILLKSASFPGGMTWSEAGRAAYVDPLFGELIQSGIELQVAAIDFRCLTTCES